MVEVDGEDALGEDVGSGADDDTLAESWNGQRWAVQPTPPTGVGPASLSSVSCVSVALCTAVGSLDNDGAYSDALAEGWNGTAWMVQSMPSPKPYASLAGVSCVPSLCVAVGSVQTDKGAASPLAEATP